MTILIVYMKVSFNVELISTAVDFNQFRFAVIREFKIEL